MKNYRQEIRALNTPLLKNLEFLLLRNWWIILFSLSCLIAYEQGVYTYRDQTEYLTSRLNELESRRKELLAEQQNLRLQINSQSDPSWIELTLMKVLGVVPEGQKKVYFQKQSID